MTKPIRALPAVRTRAALAAAAVLLSLCAFGPSAAHASVPKNSKDKKKAPTTGRIEISTQPAGYPITIDGQPAGETTDYVRALALGLGMHRVEIQFPNDTRWVHEFNIIAGSKSCVALNFRPRAGDGVSAPASVREGDIITFAAVGNSGGGKPTYSWTVSPPEARVLGGSGTPTITVDTTGLAGRRVTATLVVDTITPPGERGCSTTTQESTYVLAPNKTAGATNIAGGGGGQQEGSVEVVGLGSFTATVCDCGEIATPEGSGMGKKIKKPKKP
jgi:hypothetical protein